MDGPNRRLPRPARNKALEKEQRHGIGQEQDQQPNEQQRANRTPGEFGKLKLPQDNGVAEFRFR
jgi:hypothetical protein